MDVYKQCIKKEKKIEQKQKKNRSIIKTKRQKIRNENKKK